MFARFDESQHLFPIFIAEYKELKGKAFAQYCIMKYGIWPLQSVQSIKFWQYLKWILSKWRYKYARTYVIWTVEIISTLEIWSKLNNFSDFFGLSLCVLNDVTQVPVGRSYKYVFFLCVVYSFPRPWTCRLLLILHVQLQPWCYPWGNTPKLIPPPPPTHRNNTTALGRSEASWSNHLGEGLTQDSDFPLPEMGCDPEKEEDRASQMLGCYASGSESGLRWVTGSDVCSVHGTVSERRGISVNFLWAHWSFTHTFIHTPPPP